MTSELVEGAILVAPLFVGFVVHGLCIRFGVLGELASPISRSLFGANKTYRGILCVALGTAAGFAAINPAWLELGEGSGTAQLALLGFVVGAAAMAVELPNSFLKRRVGIPPGAQGSGMRGMAFHVLDQVDLVRGLGCDGVGGKADNRSAGWFLWYRVRRPSTHLVLGLLARHAYHGTLVTHT